MSRDAPITGGSTQASVLASEILTSSVLALQADLVVSQGVERIREHHQRARPKATTASYRRWEDFWRRWCDRMGFLEQTRLVSPDNALVLVLKTYLCNGRYTVSQEKAASFLWQVVIPMKPQRGRKRKRAAQAEPGHEEEEADDGDAVSFCLTDLTSQLPKDFNNITCDVSPSTLNTAISALVDLWKRQKASNVNSFDSPRDGPASLLIKAAKLGNTVRKRATYVDKGIGSLLDGYTTTDEFRSILDWFWMENTPAGLRNRAGFTVGHHGLMRGENIRGLELSDLHFVDLENEGPVENCLAVLCTLNQGKTNQVGRMEYAAFLRNKEADLCPVGGIAFYLFYRYGSAFCFLSRFAGP